MSAPETGKVNIEELYQNWAKEDIKKKADESRHKGDTLYNLSDVEEALKKQEEERAKAREDFYRAKAAKSGGKFDAQKKHREDAEISIYKAKAALNTQRVKKKRREGVIHRTIRLFKGLSAAGKYIKENPDFMTAEKRRRMYLSVFNDAWQPLMDALREAGERLWDFLTLVWDDLMDIILFIVDLIIKLFYYLGSFFLFIWDCLWDFRLWFEEHKKNAFRYFSTFVALAAIALIGISSMSAYKYSYYGRDLGIARSKQEVYQTIEALGDKLSESSGANINLDVERDIKFTKIYGFKLDIDSADDILNTLTYMKDIQVRAYAINIDAVTAVILESEETANQIIQSVKNEYAGPVKGVEYTQITTDQIITVEEVGVQLGDIWNPQIALQYLLTGTTKDGEEGTPPITMRTTEIATYNENVDFGARFIDNSTIYADETELISNGIYGINEIVAEIQRVNGQEIKRTIKTTTRISNPVDAVFYQGTKPIPEKKGTGTFIYPIKTYTISSYFGSRNTGIKGASTYHEGVDFAASTGTKVYATDGGVVKFAGTKSGYGKVIIIDHGGLYESRYGHLSSIDIKLGDSIYQGQFIGRVGNTGVSSGPHLHFEIRYKDVAKNPLSLLSK